MPFSQPLLEHAPAESDLPQTVARLDFAMQAGGVGIWEWDVQTQSVAWNDSLRALYGRPPEATDASCGKWADALHPEDCTWVHQAINDAISHNRPFSTEFRILWPDGSTHHLRARASVQRDANDQPIKVSASTGTSPKVAGMKPRGSMNAGGSTA